MKQMWDYREPNLVVSLSDIAVKPVCCVRGSFRYKALSLLAIYQNYPEFSRYFLSSNII